MNALKAARELAGKVLNSYPDYAKATPGYTAGIIEAFARFPEAVQQELADPIKGLRGRCEFIPTIAAVVKMADEITQELARKADIDRKYGGKRYSYDTTPKVYCPFPQLAKEFGEEFLAKFEFDKLNAACRLLVLEGRQSALDCLNRKGAYHYGEAA